MFFNIGGGEILVIAMVALIAVGPEQLPSVLRKLGRMMAQARTMTAGLRQEFMSGLDEVKEIADPESWLGSGSADDPVVPRGYASRQRAPRVNEIAKSNTRSAPPPADAAAGESEDGKEPPADAATEAPADAATEAPAPDDRSVAEPDTEGASDPDPHPDPASDPAPDPAPDPDPAPHPEAGTPAEPAPAAEPAPPEDRP